MNTLLDTLDDSLHIKEYRIKNTINDIDIISFGMFIKCIILFMYLLISPTWSPDIANRYSIPSSFIALLISLSNSDIPRINLFKYRLDSIE